MARLQVWVLSLKRFILWKLFGITCVATGTRWESAEVIVVLRKGTIPSGLSPCAEMAIQQAFDQWSGISGVPGLRFVQQGEVPQIDMKWAKISSAGSAQYPPAVGDPLPREVLFNTDVSWVCSGMVAKGEYDFPTVALHELGHALGIKDCTPASGAVMCELCLTDGFAKRALEQADIDIATEIYKKEEGFIAKIIKHIVWTLLVGASVGNDFSECGPLPKRRSAREVCGRCRGAGSVEPRFSVEVLNQE